MTEEKDNLRLAVKDKIAMTSFDDHIRDAWEEIYLLGELERKYSFFRIGIPQIYYSISKNLFEMNIDYRLNLRAKHNDNYIHVDFGLPHNRIVVMHPKHSNKLYSMEAQEEIKCDPELGYKYVYKFFEEHGIIGANKVGFGIVLNNDTLRFDDQNLGHSTFRGWTKGYELNYSDNADPVSIINIMLKKDCESKPYLGCLERRINTLKTLFDQINDYALFKVEENIRPITKIPNFKEIYRNTMKSEHYKFMQEFGKNLGNKFNIHPKYEQEINMFGEGLPKISFRDINNGILFFIGPEKYKDKKASCELHVPKSLLERQEFDENYMQSSEEQIYKGRPLIGKKRELVGVVEYVLLEKDVSQGLEKCLERLM